MREESSRQERNRENYPHAAAFFDGVNEATQQMNQAAMRGAVTGAALAPFSGQTRVMGAALGAAADIISTAYDQGSRSVSQLLNTQPDNKQASSARELNGGKATVVDKEQGRKLLESYGITKGITDQTLTGVGSLLRTFKDSTEKCDNNYKCYDAASAFFSGLQQFAPHCPNKALAKNIEAIAIIGSHGVNIGKELSSIAAASVGGAVLGIGMLLPMANIALAGLSLVKALRHKDNDNHALQQALQKISSQIESLRTEMHGRFDAIENQLQDIYVRMENGFLQIKNILRSDISLLSRSLNEGVANIRDDITYLGHVSHDRFIDQLTRDFHRDVNKLESNISSSLEYSSLKSVEIQVQNDLKDNINNMENLWLLNYLCNKVSNGAQHGNASFSRIGNSYYVIENEENVLGMLSWVASHQLRLPSARAEDALPNVGLWIEGLQVALQARATLMEQHQKSIHPDRLAAIKDKAVSAIEFIDNLAARRSQLYGQLLTYYREAMSAWESALLRDSITAEVAAHAAGTVSLSAITLNSIEPDEASRNQGCLPLAAAHLLGVSKEVQLPAVLQQAAMLGLGRWEASYSASRKNGNAWHIEDSATRRIETYAESIYTIQIAFRFQGSDEVISVLKTTYQNMRPQRGPFELPWGRGGHNARQHSANVICPAWRNSQAAIPLSTLVNEQWGADYCREVTNERVLNPHGREEAQKSFPKALQFLWENVRSGREVPQLFVDRYQRVLVEQSERFKELSNSMRGISMLIHAYNKLLGMPYQIDICAAGLVLPVNFTPEYLAPLRANIETLSKALEEVREQELNSHTRTKLDTCVKLINLFESQVLKNGHIFDPNLQTNDIANQSWRARVSSESGTRGLESRL